MKTLSPYTGRTVHVEGMAPANGASVFAGIVTQPFDTVTKTRAGIDVQYVNLTVFPPFMNAQHQGSVRYYRSKADAMQDRDAGYSGPICYPVEAE